jgi:hypothetical protein
MSKASKTKLEAFVECSKLLAEAGLSNKDAIGVLSLLAAERSHMVVPMGTPTGGRGLAPFLRAAPARAAPSETSSKKKGKGESKSSQEPPESKTKDPAPKKAKEAWNVDKHVIMLTEEHQHTKSAIKSALVEENKTREEKGDPLLERLPPDHELVQLLQLFRAALGLRKKEVKGETLSAHDQARLEEALAALSGRHL